jgi:hypothetical protein
MEVCATHVAADTAVVDAADSPSVSGIDALAELWPFDPLNLGLGSPLVEQA